MTASTHQVTILETGMLRIYLASKEQFRPQGAGWLRGALTTRPLYQELVRQAKQAGLVNANAHRTHYGYSNHSHIQATDAERSNAELTMCVELIGPRARLEGFCREHGALLRDKVIVFKHLERWQVRANDPAVWPGHATDNAAMSEA